MPSAHGSQRDPLSLLEFVDATFGPRPFRVCAANVADFVTVTGDEPDRWKEAAPPGFMAAALFVVASDLLRELAHRSVIHGEQVFAWHRPLRIESELQVSGTVTRARERGGVDFVTFEVGVDDEAGLAADGSSLFLVSALEDPAGVAERSEPVPEDTGGPGPDQRSASRADLVRYAAATRDWNPIHWDHDTAVAAGLPGVVVHGLLQAAWVLAEASRHRPGDAPLATARVRFRNPMLPAVPVSISFQESGGGANVALNDTEVEYLSARVEYTDR